MSENLSKKEYHNEPVDLDIDLELAEGQNQDLDQTALPVVESEPAPDQGQSPAHSVTHSTNMNKFPVAGPVLKGRIKHVLQPKRQALKQYRGSKKGANAMAGWYIVDLDRNECIGHFTDLEVLGRELGALQPWERLASE